VSRFQDAFEQYEKHRLTGEEAGSFWACPVELPRLCVRYEEDGIEGCAIGGSARCRARAPERELERMHALYRSATATSR